MASDGGGVFPRGLSSPVKRLTRTAPQFYCRIGNLSHHRVRRVAEPEWRPRAIRVIQVFATPWGSRFSNYAVRLWEAELQNQVTVALRLVLLHDEFLGEAGSAITEAGL